MQRLENYLDMRRIIADRYNTYLEELPLTLPWQHLDSDSSFHLYVIRLKLDKIQASHRHIFETLRGEKIGVNLHYIPIYAHPYYNQFGFKKEDFPEAEAYYSEAISLPIFPTLSEEDQEHVHNILKRVLR